ncbi:hypothetical protein [Ochrobactrum sp. POC9]|uniref:hypothetical protein n=1 Tax=Ochrobactrum sp. POC9 TaxID=2203419 RepID=UPI0015E8658E|nr:hypothetical protein [Ochrobactrum sp. POC9]
MIETLVRLLQTLASFVSHFFHAFPQLLYMVIKIDAANVLVSDPVHSIMQLVVAVFL